VPHDLTDEQLNELAALVTLFDVELCEELEAILVGWAAETRTAGRSAIGLRGTVTADEVSDLAERLRSARGVVDARGDRGHRAKPIRGWGGSGGRPKLVEGGRIFRPPSQELSAD
jgi:hypothetical protein